MKKQLTPPNPMYGQDITREVVYDRVMAVDSDEDIAQSRAESKQAFRSSVVEGLNSTQKFRAGIAFILYDDGTCQCVTAGEMDGLVGITQIAFPGTTEALTQRAADLDDELE